MFYLLNDQQAFDNYNDPTLIGPEEFNSKFLARLFLKLGFFVMD